MPGRFLIPAMLVASAALAQPRPDLLFLDRTEPSGIDLSLQSGGSPSRYILEVNGGGVAVFDHDGDGDLDLFFANGATLDAPEKGPGSRLYDNLGGGKFRDITAERGIDLTRWAMGPAVGDYDNDGDDDLFVACFGKNVLLRNDVSIDGKFREVGGAAGVDHAGWGTSAAFGDLDDDGDLDLYVVDYLEFDPKSPPGREGVMFLGVNVMAGPAGLPAEHDVLYENLGDGRFRERETARPDAPGYGLGVRVLDADGDGRLDIFVGNDSQENFLFRNLGELRFEDVGPESGVASNYDGANQATMGIALGDVDGNGHPDLFTTNFSSDTNTLHLNLGKTGFDDRTSQFGLGMESRPFLSWGTGFYDFDLDGDEDLLIASGHVYPETATHKMDSTYEQPLLLMERRGARFVRNRNAGSAIERAYRGRALGFGDLDGDGDPDFVSAPLNDRVRVFENRAPQRDRLVVELRTAAGAPTVPGARVTLVAGDVRMTRWPAGGSYQSVDAAAAYFGLGGLPAKTPLVLDVRWPSGETTRHEAVPRNRKVVLRRGAEKLESIPLTRPRR